MKDQQESDYRDRLRMEGCLEAARLVAEEQIPRPEAMSRIRERGHMSDLAVQSGQFVPDENGDVEAFLDSALEGNSVRYKNPAQVRAIALELFNSNLPGCEA